MRNNSIKKIKIINVRVTQPQKEKLRAAAKRSGLGVSTWMLFHSLRAAAEATSG